MKYFLVLLSSSSILFQLASCSNDEGQSPGPDPDIDDSVITITEMEGDFPIEMDLPSVGNNGVYDATAELDPTTGRVWMVYSDVELINGISYVSSHLTYSENGGANWNYSGLLNEAEDIDPENYPPEFEDAASANWQHEVPSIVHDPAAPINERWRILWHRYQHVDDNIPGNGDRKFLYGWIGSKAASTPEGLLSAPEVKLFAAGGYRLSQEIDNYNDSFLGNPELFLDDLHADLVGALTYSEPGMVAYQGDLYVSLVHRNIERGRIVLIKHDNSTMSWEYVSTLLDENDAIGLDPGWLSFSATDLFLVDDNAFLLASPVNDIYLGTALFTLDLNSGLVQQDENGLPNILYSWEKTPGVIQTGVSTYDEGLTATGILIGDAFFESPQFRMYSTGIVISVD